MVRVEPADKDPSIRFPFFHATTSGEWVVVLRFFVPRNIFNERRLQNSLKLVPFHQGSTPVLSDAPRLKITRVGLVDEVVITAHGPGELETPAFDAFLRKAVAAALNPGEPAKLRKASEL